MSEKKVVKPVALAVGAALAGSFALTSSIANGKTVEDPFEISELSAGYMLGTTGHHKDKEGEGKCGEGSCGEKEGEGSCGEKEGEGKCGEGSCGEKEGEDKDGEGSCGGQG